MNPDPLASVRRAIARELNACREPNAALIAAEVDDTGTISARQVENIIAVEVERRKAAERRPAPAPAPAPAAHPTIEGLLDHKDPRVVGLAKRALKAAEQADEWAAKALALVAEIEQQWAAHAQLEARREELLAELAELDAKTGRRHKPPTRAKGALWTCPDCGAQVADKSYHLRKYHRGAA